jgi:type II secretory pathway pseudopilin PulG
MGNRSKLILQPERHSRLGVTLVEALVVIVMVGMLVGIAIPRFAAMRQGLQLDTAAQQLAGDLRRAQVEAIKRNQTVELAKTGASTYDIQSVPPAPATVFYARSFEQNVTFGGGSVSVRMASFGPPVGGGAAFIVDVGGNQKTVTVSAAGRISVQ